MAAPYASASSRRTPRRTSCSKSPRADVLDLNHIVVIVRQQELGRKNLAQGFDGSTLFRYSARSAWMTSIRDALAAGISDATVAAATRIIAAAAIGSGPGIWTFGM